MKKALSMLLVITMVFGTVATLIPVSGLSVKAADNDGNTEVALPKTLVNPINSEGRTMNFNQGWKFTPQYVEAATSPSYELVELQRWENVDLPHSVRLERYASSGKNGIYMGDAMYVKHFPISADNAGKRIYITFEGVMGISNVWVNGVKQTTKLASLTGDDTYYGGYLPFVIDITDDVVCDGTTENVIAVYANSKNDPTVPPGKDSVELDFSYFGGIYRDVTLTVTEGVHITDANYENIVAGGGVLVDYPSVSREMAEVYVKTHMRNETPTEASVTLKTALYDAQGVVVAEQESVPVSVAAGEDYSFENTLTVLNPKLWDLKTPHRHTLVSTLYVDGKEVDCVSNVIGIRRIEMHRDYGLKINGVVQDMLSGVNRHQEYAYIGYAASASLQRKDALKFKEAGINVVRTAHYPASVDFLDACDELGILIIEPTPGWQWYSSDPLFSDRVKNDIRQMVRRDRNRPCILAYETVLNETSTPAGFTLSLAEVAKQEHPSAKVATENSVGEGEKDTVSDIMYKNPERSDFAVGFTREYGDSYREQSGEDNFFYRRVFRGTGMDYAFYPGGEGAMFMQAVKRLMGNQSDTEYYCPVDAASGSVGGSSGSGRSYLQIKENYVNGQQDCAVKYIGATSWIGIDHNRSYASDISACGLWDLLRLPKFSYYAMASQRSAEVDPLLTSLGLRSGPMVFISSYWTEKAPTLDKSNEAFSMLGTDEERIILVYSNTERVKLSVVGENGEILYEQTASPMMGRNREYINAPFQFLDVPYTRGSYLVAEGYDGDGELVAAHEVHTAQSPERLELEADTMGISPVADGSDTVMVYAYIKDSEGNVCHDAYNEMTFSIASGDAVIVGDGSSRVGANPVNAEAGIFGVYVRMGKTAGDIVIRVESDGLVSDEITLTSVPFTEPASPYYEIAYTGSVEDLEGEYLVSLPYAASGNNSGMLSKIATQTVEIGGKKYKNSALFMTNFDVSYSIGGHYNRFTSAIAVIDNGDTSAAAIFKVAVDGRIVYVSDIVTPGEVVNIDVEIPNGKVLQLITDGLSHEYRYYPQYAWLSPFLYTGQEKVNDSDLYRDIAIGKRTEASSVVSGSSSRFAVDGNESSTWIGNKVGEGASASAEYLIVDLGEAKDLSGARVGLLNDSITYKYKIQVSADKQAWTTVKTVSKTGQASDIRDIFSAQGVRYVKILFTEIGTDEDRGQYSNAAISGLEVYEDRGVSSVKEFKLHSLGIYGKDMVFDPYKNEYTVNLEGYETELGIFAKAFDEGTVITVNGVPMTTDRFTVDTVLTDGVIKVRATSASGRAYTEYSIKIVGKLGNIFYDNAMDTMAETKNGERRWLYTRYDTATGKFVELTGGWVYANNQPYNAAKDSNVSWARVGAVYAHPGSGENKVARSYVAPVDGEAELHLYAAKLYDISGIFQTGDVGLSVYKNGERIWPLDGEHALLNTNVISVAIPVTLAKGDVVHFVLDNWDGSNSMDATYMDTTVCYTVEGAVTAENFTVKHKDILAKTVNSVSVDDKDAVVDALGDLAASNIGVRRELVEQRRLLENLGNAIKALENGSKPIGVESFSYTFSTGGVFTPPTSARIYMSDGTSLSASVTWTDYDASILLKPGVYRINGTVSGYNETTYLNLKVTSISQSERGDAYPFAFASFSNISDGTGGDLVSFVNDGTTAGNWTTYRSSNAQEWLGIAFGQKKAVDRITLRLPSYNDRSSTQAPTLVKVQYYIGPLFSELPADVNKMSGTSHPLADDANWADAVITSQEEFGSLKTSAIEINTVQTSAIRLIMTPNKRPATGQSGCIAIVEMECHEAVLNANSALNTSKVGLPLAFASFSNISGGTGGDLVNYVNDGKTAGNWTTYMSSNAQEWLGMLFGEDGVIKERGVETVTLRMPRISTYATQRPNLIKVQYYVGPSFTELPADANNMLGTSHPLANDANWADATILSQEPFESEATSAIVIERVETVAIRLVMTPNKRPSGAAGCIGVIEMECYDRELYGDDTPDISGILVDGKAVEGFDPEKTDYTVKITGVAVPEISVLTGDNSATTVLKPLVNGGEAVIIVTAENGFSKKVITVRLDNSEALDFVIYKDLLLGEIEDLVNRYDRAEYTDTAWAELCAVIDAAIEEVNSCTDLESLNKISADSVKKETDAVRKAKASSNLGTKVNLTLYSDIELNFYASESGGLLGIEVNGVAVPASEQLVDLGDGSYYAYRYLNIAPSCGARSLNIKLRYLSEGRIKTREVSYSILTYAEAVFGNDGIDESGKELVKSVVGYVKAAYEYFGDEGTSSEQAELLNRLAAQYPAHSVTEIPKVEGIDPSPIAEVVESAQFSLSDGTIRLALNIKDTDAPITVRAGEQVIVSLAARHGQKRVYVNLRAYQLTETLTISSGEKVGTYSFFAYSEGVGGTDEKLDALLLSMYSYSLAATEYKIDRG